MAKNTVANRAHNRAKNIVYAQSGGVTPVINASACGAILAAQASERFHAIYAGWQGVHGVLEENLIDLSREPAEHLHALAHTPGGAFGSCRRKLRGGAQDEAAFRRILQVFDAHDVQVFLYNGGNDSMDTVAQLARYAKAQGSDVQVLGIPKTIDNDLPITDSCPGFGSVAKYNAVSMLEAGLDTASMYRDSTKVFVLETMGRHAGWIAAATGLAAQSETEAPHVILLPERPFVEDRFLAEVERVVGRMGWCAVTVSEGVRNAEGGFLSEAGGADSFGHAQLGGAGAWIQACVRERLGLKVHGAILDYCQRAAGHLVSAVDLEHALACGRQAVALAETGCSGEMVTLVRDSDEPYRWSLGHADAAEIANQEKRIPDSFIREDGYGITDAFRRYALPLIHGERPPPYREGLPDYVRLRAERAPKRLPAYVE